MLGLVAIGCSPDQAESDQAGSNPAESNQAGSNPAESNQAGSNPAESNQAGSDQAGSNPAESNDVVLDGVVAIESTGADTVRDLIRPDDPSAFVCVADRGTATGEFFDKVTDELVYPDDTHFFAARYADGAEVEIRIHPDLVTDEATAIDQALRIAEPIGLLPTELRSGIERVGFLGGDATAQADGGGEGIHVYADNVARREQTGRFEETLFHESVHTSLDDRWAFSDEWSAAQAADGQFLTAYAADRPEREDLAETALYSWALLHHPDRVSAADAEAWRSMVPNRIAVIGTILSGPPPPAGGGTPSC